MPESSVPELSVPELSVPELSVVVCTNRGKAHLGSVLTALSAQTLRANMEVIVVDDGAPERLDELCQAHGARLCRHPRNLGLAAARNTGWKAARSDLVAFTDDDCRPQVQWAEHLHAAFSDAEGAVLAAGGPVRAATSDGYLNQYYGLRDPFAPLEAELAQSSSLAFRLWLYLGRSVRGPNKTGRRPVASLAGANMAFRRSVLENLGGFDPGVRFGGEDEDLFYRLRQAVADARVVFEPGAVVDHDFRPSLSDALRRARSYGRGNARNFVKHPQWGPTVFPVPLAVLGLSVAAARRPGWAVGALLVPVVAFPRYALEARRRGRPVVASFAYLQLLEEAASDIGFVAGWWHFRKAAELGR